MKARIATIISLAGVFAAGTAAALVNTQVLGGSSSPSPLVAEAAAAPEAQQTALNITVPASTTAIATPVVETLPAAGAAAAPAVPASTQAMYAIGDSGTVTLDTVGDKLTIVAVAPADGWTVTASDTSDDALNATISFQADGTEVQFHANLSFGVVTTAVEAQDVSALLDATNATNGGGESPGDDSGDDSRGGGGDD
jgi:hypothetical protein